MAANAAALKCQGTCYLAIMLYCGYQLCRKVNVKLRTYDQLGGDDSPLADAIIDRIAHDSYRINITSIDAAHDISMREVYGLDKTLRE